jgi:hypothetical protein
MASDREVREEWERATFAVRHRTKKSATNS